MVMGERLRVRSVTIQYATESGPFTAVEDVSFAVEAGERFVLLGDRILVLSSGPGHVVQILANPAVGERETERALGVQRAVQAVLA